MLEKIKLSQYILLRLRELGCEDIFGVPGDYSLSFCDEIIKSGIKYIGTCNELNAGYAADAYSRVKGIGVLSTTFVVGELSAINAVAGSYSEELPIVHIGSAPSSIHFKNKTKLHHTLEDYHISQKMYSLITVSNILIDKVDDKTLESIDNTLIVCKHYSKPVYIGLCADMVDKMVDKPLNKLIIKKRSGDKKSIDKINNIIQEKLLSSYQPLLIIGYEIMRFNLKNKIEDILNKYNIPYSTMLMDKTSIEEDNPRFIGMYCGDKTQEKVKNYLENSDCLIMLGVKLTDFNTGFFTAKFPLNTIQLNNGQVYIGDEIYQDVYIEDILKDLDHTLSNISLKLDSLKYPIAKETSKYSRYHKFNMNKEELITIDSLYSIFANNMLDNINVMAETGTSLFACSELLLNKNSKFYSQSYFGSIGYTIGGLLGLETANKNNNKRSYLFVGDGSLQVTVQDISTILRHNYNPIIVIINNDGYTIERVIHDNKYNDIKMWKYYDIVNFFDFKDVLSFNVYKQGDFYSALNEINNNKNKAAIIEVHLDKYDCNDILKQAGVAMAKNSVET